MKFCTCSLYLPAVCTYSLYLLLAAKLQSCKVQLDLYLLVKTILSLQLDQKKFKMLRWLNERLPHFAIARALCAMLPLHQNSCRDRDRASLRGSPGCVQKGSWPPVPTRALLLTLTAHTMFCREDGNTLR